MMTESLRQQLASVLADHTAMARVEDSNTVRWVCTCRRAGQRRSVNPDDSIVFASVMRETLTEAYGHIADFAVDAVATWLQEQAKALSGA